MSTFRTTRLALGLAFAVGLTASIGTTTLLATVPTSGLVARYKMNGNAKSSAGVGLNGVNHGAVPCADRFGVAGSAYFFDGETAYVEVADSPVFSVIRPGDPTSGALSFSFWVRPDTKLAVNGQPMLDPDGDLLFARADLDGYVNYIGKGDPGQREWTCRIYSGDNTAVPNRQNRMSFYLFNLDGDLGAGAYVQEKLVSGQWIHYVAAIDVAADTITWYKNGVQRHQVPFQDSVYEVVPEPGSSPLRFGSRDLSSFLRGALDDFCVYNRALTEAEVQLLFNDVPNGWVYSPVPSVAGGYYDGPVSVSLSCATSGSSIYYTLDGSVPTNSSTRYTGPVSVGSTATLRAIGYKASATNPVSPERVVSYVINPLTYQMASSQLALEAEKFNTLNPVDGQAWCPVAETGALGVAGANALAVAPDVGVTTAAPGASSPRATYKINIPAGSASAFYVHVRGRGVNSGGDSIHVSIDNDTATYKTISPLPAALGWKTSSGALAIPAGAHNLTLWMREDGAVVDRIVLSTTSTAPSGSGPVESARY